MLRDPVWLWTEIYRSPTRLTITDIEVTFTNCKFTNMKYTITGAFNEKLAGGSAISVYTSTYGKTTTISIVSCSFSKCSVESSSKVYAGCVYLYNLHTSSHSVDSCSFADWYPSTDSNSDQNGGGIGTYYTAAPLQITNTNFTLSGVTTNKNHGGFFASTAPTHLDHSTTIANCRFIGDAITTGFVVNINSTQYLQGSFSVTDSQIIDTNSQLVISKITFTSSSGFTRTKISNTSIGYISASCTTNPIHLVDCNLTQGSISFGGSTLMILFSGTNVTGKHFFSGSSNIYLYSTSHVVLHQCDFTDCSTTSTQYIIYSYRLPSLVVDTCSFTRCSGGYSTLNVEECYSFFYFCSFTNVTGSRASAVKLTKSYETFFDSCRFDLLESNNVLDVVAYSTADITCLNETSVIGCTSNRKMYVGIYWADGVELTSIDEIPVEAEKSEMRVGTWTTKPEEQVDEESTETEPTEEEDSEQQIQTFSSLSEALGSLQPSPITNVINFTDGVFIEPNVLSVSQIVEIVGTGSNVRDTHSTQLTTNGFISTSNGRLILHSLRLVPGVPSGHSKPKRGLLNTAST
ncbi:hypothetical protein BLNAU_6144 [Blattamonas nauphoetae]|uniref:Right handed beta helix domain-containing protein n=1 Tax=Blattamonas nauphoetae TaxID=2049346 RepID=A0ABQ9Y5D0_9EUKA|nr:hypothetical protein BLNAU_6144 [Blattamonas nauphoetae]